MNLNQMTKRLKYILLMTHYFGWLWQDHYILISFFLIEIYTSIFFPK